MQAIDLLIPFKVVAIQLQIQTANSFEFKRKMSQQKAQSHAEVHDLVHTSAVPVLGRLGTMHSASREYYLNVKLGSEVCVQYRLGCLKNLVGGKIHHNRERMSLVSLL